MLLLVSTKNQNLWKGEWQVACEGLLDQWRHAVSVLDSGLSGPVLSPG